jgi:hypothetical protein
MCHCNAQSGSKLVKWLYCCVVVQNNSETVVTNNNRKTQTHLHTHILYVSVYKSALEISHDYLRIQKRELPSNPLRTPSTLTNALRIPGFAVTICDNEQPYSKLWLSHQPTTPFAIFSVETAVIQANQVIILQTVHTKVCKLYNFCVKTKIMLLPWFARL